MKKKMLNVPPEEDLNDELRSHYDIDYSKTRPNRFAGGQQIIVGAVPSGYRPPSPTASPIQMTSDDDLLPEYDIDYSKAKRNRFAGKKQVVIGPVPKDYEATLQKRGARKSDNGSRTGKTVVAKRVYLYPHQIKILARIDKNLSAAVRKLVDQYKFS